MLRKRFLVHFCLCLLLILAISTPAFADLTASVTLAGNGTIYPGETTSLQITLSNTNDSYVIENVGFSNSLPGAVLPNPNGLKISGTATYTCTDPATGITTDPGTETLTAVSGTQAISLSGGIIPMHSDTNGHDGYCTIIIPVTAGTSTGNPATYTYTILSSAVNGFENSVAVSNSGNVSQSVNVQGLAKPTISKSFVASTLYLGGSSTTLSITITNTNPVALTNVGITDVFPALANPQAGGVQQGIIRVAATPNASFVCPGGTNGSINPAAGDTSIGATGGTLAANGTCTVSVDVEANHTNGQYSVTQTNTINASTQFFNDVGIPAFGNATRNITVRSPLAVTKAVNAGAVAAGEAGHFTITLTNRGLSPLTASFTDNPIDTDGAAGYGLTVTSATSSCGGTVTPVDPGSVGRNTGISASGLSISASGSCTVTINFTGTVQTPNTPRAYTNTLASGAVDVGDPTIISQQASAAVTVYDTLNVSKSVSPANAAPGNPVQYQVTVQNWSSGAITNVAITDSLPNNQTFLTGLINGIDYTPSAGSCGLTVTGTTTIPIFTIGSIPARSGPNTPGSCTVTFYAMTSTNAAVNSHYTNTLAASTVCYNPGSGNICNGAGSNTPSGNIIAVLSATKTFSPAGPLAESSISTMTIALTNNSANPLTNVTISDTLPIANVGGGQLRIATPANAASTCGTPSITAGDNSTSLAMNSGTITARLSNGAGAAGTCFIKVDVIGPAGTYHNSASIAGTETYADGTPHTVVPITATADLTYNSSLSAMKSFSPTSVSSGGKSTVTIRINNTGASQLTNVGVIDPLPPGMVVAPIPNAYTTCAGSPVVMATAVPGSVTMTGATIAGSGNCDLLFDVVATGSANWVNTIPIGNITADGGVRNQTAVAATLIYNSPTNISVIKATNPSTLTFPGQVSQLTITITNGSQAVTNLRLIDYFTMNGTSGSPLNGMAISATPAAATTCTGGIVSATAGGTSIGVTGVSLAAGVSCTVSVNVTSTAVGGITNYIPASSIITDQGLTNSTTVSTSLTTGSNIGVVKQFTPNVVKPGQRSRLRITFYNPTSLPMANLAVTDTLPANVTVPGSPNFVTTCTGATVSSSSPYQQVQVSGGTIAAASGGVSASCYVETDVIVAAQGDYVNTIAPGAVTASSGGASTSNSQPTSDTLHAKSPLVVHKAISGYTLDAGNPAGFTTGTASHTPGSGPPPPPQVVIWINNPNAVPLTAAAFTDTLPTGLVVATTPNASITCAGGTVIAPASATSIRLSGATIPASGNCTVTVDVLSNISGSYTNTIAAGSITTFEGVSNEEPTSAKIIISTPPAVSKQFAPAVIPPNGTSTLTIFLGNANSSVSQLQSVFTDTLPTAPGNIVVANPANVGGTCPGTVTANVGSGNISYASGAQIPAGGCTIIVNVTGSTSGVYTNNIPAGALVTDFGSNQQPANSTLTISTMGFISGKVFKDNNVTPNGIFDGTDTPISGVNIELRSGTNCSNALVNISGLTNPATTDAAGNYLFSGLPAGTYSVCEPVQPTGTVNGITTAGTIVRVNNSTGTAGTASNPTSTTSQIVNIVLNGNGLAGEISGSTGNNFAEVVLSSISGTVFLDQNDNGTQDGADLGIANVTIELLNNVGSVAATTTTDANGIYSFANLQPGTYSVREPNQPANTANGITTAGTVSNGGTAGTATTPTTVPSIISNIILPPNTATTGNNFAEIPLSSRISGVVFLDFNNDGIFNGSDHGIGSQTLNLDRDRYKQQCREPLYDNQL